MELLETYQVEWHPVNGFGVVKTREAMARNARTVKQRGPPEYVPIGIFEHLSEATTYKHEVVKLLTKKEVPE